ncbi:MAG: hypothetical protein ACXAEB_09495 [Candidatus Thorarchaeota archaeon]|jgi:hypothetical protein
MRLRVKKRALVSLVAVAVFLFSMAYAGTTAALPYDGASDNSPSYTLTQDFNPEFITSQEPDPGTDVWWRQDANSTSDEWIWENKNWLFGPTPTVEIYHEDDSIFDVDSFADINEKVNFSVVVPKGVFNGGTDLREVSVYGWYRTANWNYSASFDFRFDSSMTGIDRWMGGSYQWNSSDEYGPPLPSFIDLVTDECTIRSDVNAYYVSFIVMFTADAPLGLYGYDMSVVDTEWNWINSNNYGMYVDRTIAVGIPPSEAWDESYGASYTLEKLDLDGDDLYSVSRNSDFRMRFNVSGQTPEYVMLSFYRPNGAYNMVNRTVHHQIVTQSVGAWEYDDTLLTYIWNSSKIVVYTEEVIGVVEEPWWTELGSSELINVTRIETFYDEFGYPISTELINDSYNIERQYYYVWNKTTLSFDSYYGYMYYGYPYETIQPEQDWNQDIFVLEPIPEGVPTYFELNAPASSATDYGNEYIVEFVGHFTDDMPKSNPDEYTFFEPFVMGPNNQQYWSDTGGELSRQTWQEFDAARRVSIEVPVTIARVLNSDGTEDRGWIFSVDEGDNFMVEGQLQGSAGLADDIDGVSFSMNAYTGRWTEDESYDSSLTFEFRIDMLGNPTLTAFNRTTKHNKTLETRMDYVTDNVTGWYEVFNETANKWQWAYGIHEKPVWKEVSDYFWKSWSYNQITGKWQQEYFWDRSPETRVDIDFGSISDFTNWTVDGDLFVNFQVNLSTVVPETNYWWDFSFMNLTWYQDDSLGHGWNEVYSWNRYWAYSFDTIDGRVFMGDMDYNKFAFSPLNWTSGPTYLEGLENPYIEIDGEDLPVEVIEFVNPDGYNEKHIFLREYVDGVEQFFYMLANGTRIDVSFREAYYIYNMTASNGDSFLTGSDYHYHWDFNGTEYVYWIDIDGVVHQGDYSTYSRYNLDIQVVDKIEITNNPSGWFFRYGESGLLDIVDWQWSSVFSGDYLTSKDGDLYRMEYNYTFHQWQILIDSIWYNTTWSYYYTVDYLGSDAYLVNPNWQRFFYTEVGGVEYELPYPGAEANDEWQMDRTEMDGGRLKTSFSLVYNDIVYPVYNVTEFQWFVDIGPSTYEVVNTFTTYVVANDTEIWNPETVGYTVDVGTFDANLNFEYSETVSYSMWSGDRLYLLNNASYLVLNETYLIFIYEYDLNGTTFYSTQQEPYGGWNETLQKDEFFYEALDGTLMWLDYHQVLPKVNTYTAEAFHNITDSWYWANFLGDDYKVNIQYPSVHTYRLENSNSSDILYLNYMWGSGIHNIYNITYHGQQYNATAKLESVNQLTRGYGATWVHGLSRIPTALYKNYWELIYGVPEWGMWGFDNWDVEPESGALDLDGDFDTTDDQYYVQEVYSSHDYWNHTYDFMNVNLRWDPNGTLYGDEMNVNSWLGLDIFSWRYEWSQTFYWYHADDFSQLSGTEMISVQNQLLTPENESRPGFWNIAWMARNVTWEDILRDAEANGWDWINSNEQTWTWLSFGIDQNYGTSYQTDDVDHYLNVGMHYEFSGLMIWEDMQDDGQMDIDLMGPGMGDMTHYLIPDSVESVSFVTPGEAYGNTNPTDQMFLNITDEVTWGVSFNNVNGTVFPFLYGYWGWYDSILTGADFRTFDERPTKVSIDEISFLVHFQGYLNETADAVNNYAEIKVDNSVGEWDVDMIGGQDNLENRSLALNYFADVNMHDFAFKANGSFTGGETVVSSETFEFETQGARFAEMIMGGVTYDWGGNSTSRYEVDSQTTPVGAFQAAFESDTGQSATAWSFSSSQFYVTIGFPEWDGYSVYQDPVFVGYTSALGTTAGPGGPVQFGAFSLSPTVPTESDTVQIGVDVYSTEMISGATLYYSDNLEANVEDWGQSEMWEDRPGHWVGDVPPYPDETEVFFLVVVHGEFDSYSSEMHSYIVGQGLVGPTGPTGPTGPGGEFGPLSTEMLVLLIGGAAVVAIVAVLAKRRNR